MALSCHLPSGRVLPVGPYQQVILACDSGDGQVILGEWQPSPLGMLEGTRLACRGWRHIRGGKAACVFPFLLFPAGGFLWGDPENPEGENSGV